MKKINLFILLLLISAQAYSSEYGSVMILEDIAQTSKNTVTLSLGRVVDNSLIDSQVFSLKYKRQLNRYLALGLDVDYRHTQLTDEGKQLEGSFAKTGVVQKVPQAKFSVMPVLHTSFLQGKMSAFDSIHFDSSLQFVAGAGITGHDDTFLNNKKNNESFKFGLALELQTPGQLVTSVSLLHFEDGFVSNQKNSYNQLMIGVGRGF